MTERNKSMIQKQCRCVEHGNWVPESASSKVLHVNFSKRIKKSTVSFIRNHNLLPPRCFFICTQCLDQINKLLEPKLNDIDQSTSFGVKKPGNPLKNKITEIIDSLQASSFEELSSIDDEIWKTLFRVLGQKFVSKRLNSDGNNISQIYISDLMNVDLSNYVFARESSIVAFIEGCTNKLYNNLPNSGKMKFIHTLENIYGLANFNWVLPFSFSTNLMQSTISGSKIVAEVNGKVTSGGGYTTYLNWLKENGSEPIKCPKGDIQTYIDNIGKYITKSYRVSKEKAHTAEVITTTLHLELPDKKLQIREDLKPIYWKYNIEQDQKNMEQFIEESRAVFRRCRVNYITALIGIYNNDKTEVNKRIDTLLKNQNRKCINVVSIIHLDNYLSYLSYFLEVHKYLVVYGL